LRVEVPSPSVLKTRLAAAAMYGGMGGVAVSFAIHAKIAAIVAGASAILMIAGGAYIAVRSRSALVVTWIAYVLLIAAGAVVRGSGHPARWTLWAIAGATIAAALTGMALVIRELGREKELERAISLEATSLAFLATMIGAVTYALLEVWVKAPHVSMWWVWGFGMGAWVLFSIVLGRRYE
jgi:hypothetical protein